jgi:putative chitinase
MADANPICGINAAVDDLKAGIDSLKDSISQGLDGLGSISDITKTIGAKLSEINVPEVPKVNLQDELANLSNVAADQYEAKVRQLKEYFGDSVPNLDEIINKIPKPEGVDAAGAKDIFAQLQSTATNIGSAIAKAKEQLNNLSLEALVADICKEVPNIEVAVETKVDEKTGDVAVVVTKPIEVASPPKVPTKDPEKETPPTPVPVGKFTFAFTREKLVAAGGKAAGDWYDAMYVVLPKYNITTPERVAAFVANCKTETNFTTLVENLNYKAAYLFNHMNPGKIRFPTLADAEEVARKGQEAIANVVYMVGRKLYDPQPGDGWKYRGRGLIQLTFKDGYLRASKDIYQDDRLVKNPDLVATDKQVAIDTAAWYFKRGNVNSWADKFDWGNCRSIVNAGSPGKDPTKIHGYTTAVKSSEEAYKIFKG